MKIDTQHLPMEQNDYTSPPPSPPPIHTLYTDGSIYRGTYSSPLISHLPTHYSHNQKPVGNGYTRSTPLLNPQPPHGDNDMKSDKNKKRSSAQQPIPSPSTPPQQQQRRMYKYMRKLTIYLMKQLMKKNNLALVINLVHQGWRARFFVARTIQHTRQTLATYPFQRDYVYYRDAIMQAGKLILLLAKKEHQNEQRLLDWHTLMGWSRLYMAMILVQMTTVARLGIKTSMGALKHLGAWDSLMMAFTSVALTRSLQNPTRWM